MTARDDAAGGGGWVLGNRYRVLEPLGSGAMADVYRARDTVLLRDVAIKVFRHVARHPGDLTAAGNAGTETAQSGMPTFGDARERQQREVAALARLNHPNLITLYDGSIDKTSSPAGATEPAYIVMELIGGLSLAARIATGPLPEPLVREIAVQLADGLAYVHAHRMVHRDVKPANILLGSDATAGDSTVRARLSDFGIVRLLDTERLTSAEFTLGTASYLAPEQARGSHVDSPADIYSLGLVLLEALTGRRAFDGPPLEAALARLDRRPEIPAGLPAPWPALLDAMTETDPGRRPRANDIARTLRTGGSRALSFAPAAVSTPPAAATGLASAPTGWIHTGSAAPAVASAHPAPVHTTRTTEPPRARRVNATAVVAGLSAAVIAASLAFFVISGSDAKAPAQTPGGSPVAQQSHSAGPHKATTTSRLAANTRNTIRREAAHPTRHRAASPTATSSSMKSAASPARTGAAAPNAAASTSAPAPGAAASATNAPASAATAPAPSSPAQSPDSSSSAPNSTPTAPAGSSSAGAAGPSSDATTPAGGAPATG